jgi:hypothetical protein
MKPNTDTKTLTTILALLMLACAASAATVTVNVPGTSNPWLAGMPDSTTADSDDIAPTNSPILVAGVSITPGLTLSFRATGAVSVGGINPLEPPDGGANSGTHRAGAEHGISDINAADDSLLGVFLDDSEPSLSAAPDMLDFSSATNRSYATLTPILKQVFFIGDGFDATGGVQQVTVPVGATRLFLGTMDGFGWHDNLGSFEVIVTDDGTFPATLNIAAYAGITIIGTVGRTYVVQYATDIGSTNWLSLTNVILPYSPYLFFDTSGPMSSRRFYRAYDSR